MRFPGTGRWMSVAAALLVFGLVPARGEDVEEDRAAAALKEMGADVVRGDTPDHPVIGVAFSGPVLDGNSTPFSGVYVTDAAIDHLATLKSLRTLNLNFGFRDVFVRGSCDAALARFKGMTSLRELDLGGTDVSDTGLKQIAAMTQLRMLKLSYNSDLSDDGLSFLVGMTELRELDLSNTKISDGALIHLKGMANLQTLNLSNTLVTNAGLENLPRITNLQTLNLSRIHITDAGLENLPRITNLRSLDLSYTQVTDAGMKHLESMNVIPKQGLQETRVGDAGLRTSKGSKTWRD